MEHTANMKWRAHLQMGELLAHVRREDIRACCRPLAPLHERRPRQLQCFPCDNDNNDEI